MQYEEVNNHEPLIDETPLVFGLDSPEKLKRWLLETGREYIVLLSADLVDALPWPSGVEALQQIVHAYSQHRRALDAPRLPQLDLALQPPIQDPSRKAETLDADELEDAIRCLVRDLKKIRPDWRPAW